jgi:LPXTG-site transpeptidase (sortase) family protein
MRAGAGLQQILRGLSRRSLPAGRRTVLLAGLGLAALLACALLVWFFAFGDSHGSDGSQSVVVAATATRTATPTPVPPVDRLIIPAIDVDAAVTTRVVADNGEMPSPDGPQQVISYDFSALPGLGGIPGVSGNIVFGGHVDYHDYGPAIFWDLRDLKQGDEITVRLRDGTQYRYATRSNRVVDPAATPFNQFVASTPEESLTVITCAGDFDPETHNYDMRRVVWAVRVG